MALSLSEQSPVVIVTRPEREALPWAQGLQAEGVQAEIFPLIEQHFEGFTQTQK